MNAREAILNKLRAERDALKPTHSPDSDFTVVAQRDWDAGERVQRFIQAITAVHAEVHRVSRSAWPDKIQQLVQEKGLRTLWASNDTHVGQQLAERWALQDAELRQDGYPVETWKHELFVGVDAAFTECHGAIAETGSLILCPTSAEPRLMSLVPPVHFALLEPQEIYATLHEAMLAQQWVEQGMPTNMLLISGPSKTADIEQTLAYGVHGPRELIVLILQD